jgi:hypothetical protein
VRGQRLVGCQPLQTQARQQRQHPARTRAGHTDAPALEQLLRPGRDSLAGIVAGNTGRHRLLTTAQQALAQGMHQHRLRRLRLQRRIEHHRFHRRHRRGIGLQRTLGNAGIAQRRTCGG